MNKRTDFDGRVSVSRNSISDDWSSIHVHNIPRPAFDDILAKETVHKSFWTKEIEFGMFSTITFHCTEPPTGVSNG